MERFSEWIKAERHSPLNELMETLCAKYTGYWNYYGIGNGLISLLDRWQSGGYTDAN